MTGSATGDQITMAFLKKQDGLATGKVLLQKHYGKQKLALGFAQFQYVKAKSIQWVTKMIQILFFALMKTRAN